MASPIEVVVPDIGGFKDVNVIDVLGKNGQQVEKETPLVTIETEKAAMDVPSPIAGKIAEVKLKTGDKVSEGSLILLMEPSVAAEASPADGPAAAASPAESASAPKAAPRASAAGPPAAPARAAPAPKAAPPNASAAGAKSAVSNAQATGPSPAQAARERSAVVDEKAFSTAHASPSVRKFARELGADLGHITGTGVKGRIT